MWQKWILAFIVSLPAWGFNFTQDFTNGFYWKDLPVKISVVDDDPARKAMLEELSGRAIDEWERDTGLELWELLPEAGGNIIRWSNNFAVETNMDPKSVLAVAIRYTNGPYFARTEIIINGAHYLNTNIKHLYTTLVHELGHTMGLDHSDDQLAVMAPTLQDPYRGLQDDDIQGMSMALAETQSRQQTGYISPLAYEKSESSSAVGCGTVSAVSAPGQGWHTMFSLLVGMLIGFVRKVLVKFKSLRFSPKRRHGPQ